MEGEFQSRGQILDYFQVTLFRLVQYFV